MLAVMLAGRSAARADEPQQKPGYTMVEYNAFQAAANERIAAQRVKLLDDFVSKYPQSELLPFVYQSYYTTYNELKNYPKVVEYADKLRALGDKVDVGSRFQALYVRASVYEYAYNARDPNAKEQLARTIEAAREGLDLLGKLPKPENVSAEQYEQSRKQVSTLFHNTIGFAALQLRDYNLAAESFQLVLANDPNQALAFYRLGVAYLQQDPAKHMDGFWALARAIGLKIQNEPQVRTYLRGQMNRYQQTTCEPLLDAQMNELLALTGGSPERPADYKIPSAADLDKTRQESTILSVLADLKAGGERGKLVWLATCGLEFPEVPSKVIEVAQNSDTVILKVFTAATNEEMEAATTPNMEVMVIGQPEAKRIVKDQGVRFSGILLAHDPEPFMIHWDKAKVNPEDIPGEKPQPGKPPAKSGKRPSKRPPAR